MKKLLERQINLTRINKKRNELELALQTGLILEEDIIDLIKKDTNYGVKVHNISGNPKEAMLKNIFNCPFLLCDQDMLSPEFKKLLPCFLSARYEAEKDILRLYFEQTFLDEDEYKEELENLKFFYYESSNDGKSILETGHVIFEKKHLKSR